MLSKNEIARVTHEANRAYCFILGDTSQKPWDESPQWQRDSSIEGVKTCLEGSITSEQLHETWLQYKKEEGWTYGLVKDPKNKTHPCMVPYNELPKEQKIKDKLFSSIVEVLR